MLGKDVDCRGVGRNLAHRIVSRHELLRTRRPPPVMCILKGIFQRIYVHCIAVSV